MFNCIKILLSAFLFFTFTSAYAKITVDRVDHPRKVVVVKIIERILYEEDIEFEKELIKLESEGYSIKNNSIAFNTQGGNSHAAKEIGKIIRKRRLNTYLAPTSVCGSACIYALIGGIVRNVYGEVTVHRSSYNDTVPLEKIKKFTDWGDAKIYRHIYEMGINSQLATAVFATPHWTRRLITKSELDAWSINGMDRMYEEFSVRNLAAETQSSIDDVQEKMQSIIKTCEKNIVNFTMSQWECIRIKYYWAMKKIRYEQIPPKPPTYLINKFNYNKTQGLLGLD
jgi:hypothetical protein